LKKHGSDVSTELYGEFNHDDPQLTETALIFSECNGIVVSKEWANFELENGLDGRGPRYSINLILNVYKCFKNKKEIEEKYPGILHAAKNYNILDDITAHMIHSSRKWIKSSIIDVAKSFKRKKDFMEVYPGAADAARKLKIWDDVTKHMESKRTPKFTKEEVLEDAKLYKHKEDYNKKSKMSNVCRGQGWWGEATEHMVNPMRGKKLNRGV
jgi:hypothetical protein